MDPKHISVGAVPSPAALKKVYSVATNRFSRSVGHVGPVGPLSPTWRTSRFRLVLRPRMPSRAQTPGSAAPVRRTATCWCSGAGDAPPPRRGARSDLDRRAASWAHGGLGGLNGTWGSRQSGCCSISDGTVARVGICCFTGSAMRWRDPPTWVNGRSRSTVY